MSPLGEVTDFCEFRAPLDGDDGEAWPSEFTQVQHGELIDLAVAEIQRLDGLRPFEVDEAVGQEGSREIEHFKHR